MKVIILAGGRGSRLGADVPKPMVDVGGIPLLSHIMGIYRKFGYNEFVIACGYKGNIIRRYYKGQDNVQCIDTGLDSGTAERVRICAEHTGTPFMLTYGDGLADIDINVLAAFHDYYKGMLTVTAIHPPPRFGQLVLRGADVFAFEEKPVEQHDWVNGGFFVSDVDPDEGDISWEFDVLPRWVNTGLFHAYRHEGNWRCMDTPRDLEYLNQLWQEGRAFWT